jgi:hypothetical protein
MHKPRAEGPQAPVSVSYARALLRHVGKTREARTHETVMAARRGPRVRIPAQRGVARSAISGTMKSH